MYLLYSLLLFAGILILLPRFVFDAITHGKYVEGIRQRLGDVPTRNTVKPVIWLHCVSVGETLAAVPLARGIKDTFPEVSLVVSTTTVTGNRIANNSCGGIADQVIYFPIDFAWIVRRSLNRVRPDAVVVMETELWPNFLRECSRRRIPLAIVNGRISPKSYRRYGLVKSWMGRILNYLSLAIMQSDGDAERIVSLGMPAARTHVTGNIKFDISDSDVHAKLAETLAERFGLSGGRPVIVAASTHDPEERVVLTSFKRLLSPGGSKRPRLLIAPRHPERFELVAEQIRGFGLSWVRRSEPRTENDMTSDVILLDSIGELRSVYPLADVVFVGGSIAAHGGHNVLEPAAAGTPVVTGPHTHNFSSIVAEMRESGALIQLAYENGNDPSEPLAAALETVLYDATVRKEMTEAAHKVITRNRGATQRTIGLLNEMLQSGIPQVPSGTGLPAESNHLRNR